MSDAQAGHLSAPPDAFRFGRNWQRYVEDYLTPERERIAAKSVRELLETDLAGKTFLDIGCGSGLFSLCAHQAGASAVVSVDVDADSVAATESLRGRVGAPASWRVIQGSILDEALLDRLEPAEVVYSWGVLHHTGDMEQAIRNAATLVAPGGLFAISIYNRVTERFMSSERWLRVKRMYNHSPRPVQVAMEGLIGLYWTAGVLKNRRNPFAVAREYKHRRGMAVRTDQIDWLGGYPYEFATADEVVRLCETQCGLRTRKVRAAHARDVGTSEFVFEKPA